MTLGEGASHQDPSGTSEASDRTGVRRARAGLLILIGASAVAGLLLGWVLVTVYPFGKASLQQGSAFATGGALLATLKELFRLGPELVDYWKSGAGKGASRFAALLFVSVVALAMALNSKFNPGQIGSNLIERPQALFTSPHEPSISISFPEADTAAVTSEPIDSTLMVRLARLVEGLHACSRPNGDGDAIRVLVTGFSRSATARDADDVRIADRRAMLVRDTLFAWASYLVSGVDSSTYWEAYAPSPADPGLLCRKVDQFEICMEEWESNYPSPELAYAAMRDAGRFFELEGAALIFRDKRKANRAKIHIQDYGRCRLAYPRTQVNRVEVK